MPVAAQEISLPALRMELLEMKAADQEFRLPPRFDAEAVKRADDTNRARLKRIVETHGWPTASMVGKDGANAAWLLVQHADAEPDFQARVLVLMKVQVEKGEASAQDYAYLFDRLNTPQRFGTQGACKAKGVWAPRAIDDEGGVDQRRREMGMQPLAEYVERASRFLCVKQVGEP